MPRYEYVCPHDGTTRILDVPMSDYDPKKVVKCSACKKKMRRTWSPPSISIK